MPHKLQQLRSRIKAAFYRVYYPRQMASANLVSRFSNSVNPALWWPLDPSFCILIRCRLCIIKYRASFEPLKNSRSLVEDWTLRKFLVELRKYSFVDFILFSASSFLFQIYDKFLHLTMKCRTILLKLFLESKFDRWELNFKIAILYTL